MPPRPNKVSASTIIACHQSQYKGLVATVMEYPQDLTVQQLLGQFTNQCNRSGSDKIFPTENSTDLVWGLGETELKKSLFFKKTYGTRGIEARLEKQQLMQQIWQLQPLYVARPQTLGL